MAEALRAVAEVGLPAVIKPSDQTGSLGVVKVDSPGAVRELAAEALRLSPVGRIVVEEFLEGTEHTLAAFMVDGELHRFGFADREYGRKEEFAPYFFEGGDTLPSSAHRGTDRGGHRHGAARGTRPAAGPGGDQHRHPAHP
ncbi:hypothetical protein R2F25_37365 [Streptomyces sp. UP1A-1]|nr:hypothetical protein [Streptomyces sp. UP1A-1]